jgi:hypothetical protein
MHQMIVTPQAWHQEESKRQHQHERMNHSQQQSSLDEVVNRFHALREQDDSYTYRNYLPEGCDGNSLFNITWREKICEWSYNVVDQ